MPSDAPRHEDETKQSLSVGIALGDSIVRAQVVHLWPEKLGVFVSKQDDPGLSSGSRAEIRLECDDESCMEAVRVGRVEELESGRLYGLELIEPSALAARAPAPIAQHFNRRAAERIRPDDADSASDDVPILVRSTLSRSEVTGSLRDLSSSGLSFSIGDASSLETDSLDGLEVEFALPGTSERLRFLVAIRYRLEGPNGVKFGVRFERENDPEYDQKIERLERHIAGLLHRVESTLSP